MKMKVKEFDWKSWEKWAEKHSFCKICGKTFPNSEIKEHIQLIHKHKLKKNGWNWFWYKGSWDKDF